MPSYPLYDFDPNNLPIDLLTAIGLAITSFAQIEQNLQDAIAGCSGIDVEYGKAITTHMSTPLKISALRSVAEIRIDNLDTLDELDKQIEQVELAAKKRNDIAHRQWGRIPKTNEIFAIDEKARARLEVEIVPATIEQVSIDAKFIYLTGIKFFQFLSLHDLLPLLPSEPRSREHKSKKARKSRRKKDEKSTK